MRILVKNLVEFFYIRRRYIDFTITKLSLYFVYSVSKKQIIEIQIN